ncbi:MAG: DTW domain-containing protein YfiP [Oleiphilaceae bacterium]|jgi:DTW domain-containing protein YfiP
MSRQYCPKCHKAKSTCICQWLQVQSNQIPVLIFQHTNEQKKTLGTARLVELGLESVKVISNTVMTKIECLQALSEFQASNPILLYAHKMVNSPFHIELDINHNASFSNEQAASFDSVILLDGTWRNTRELLHKNEWLHALPTIALKNVGESRYRIRKAAQENTLATIEAVANLLSVLDEKFNQEVLLKPFDKMIDTQIAKMGEAVYLRNYQSKD